jgi:hypothetical protein
MNEVEQLAVGVVATGLGWPEGPTVLPDGRVVHVQLADLHLSVEVTRDLVDDGSERLAGATPGGGEVDQHRDTGIDNFLLEVEVVEHLNFFGCHGCSLRRNNG